MSSEAAGMPAGSQVTTLGAPRIRSGVDEAAAKPPRRLIIESTGKQIPFGVTEGLAVYLNGTDLEDEVYRTSDVNFVIDEFDRLLKGKGAFRGYWEGGRETALFCYGASYLEMKAALAPFLAEHPLCEKARVEQIA